MCMGKHLEVFSRFPEFNFFTVWGQLWNNLGALSVLLIVITTIWVSVHSSHFTSPCFHLGISTGCWQLSTEPSHPCHLGGHSLHTTVSMPLIMVASVQIETCFSILSLYAYLERKVFGAGTAHLGTHMSSHFPTLKDRVKMQKELAYRGSKAQEGENQFAYLLLAARVDWT